MPGASTVVATDTTTIALASAADAAGNLASGAVIFTVPKALTPIRATTCVETLNGSDRVNDGFLAVGITAAGQYFGSYSNFNELSSIYKRHVSGE